jgi:hypothetical protein
MPQLFRKFFVASVVAASFVGSPAPSTANDVTVVVYPRIHNFPGQQLCQIDRNNHRHREFCAPQSYHPYGAMGYRPFGTYRPYRGMRPYLLAPNAKIIRLRRQRPGSADEN